MIIVIRTDNWADVVRERLQRPSKPVPKVRGHGCSSFSKGPPWFLEYIVPLEKDETCKN